MFEEIIKIEEVGEVETYDLEIDNEFHNFYANNICVSNSHSVAYAYIAMQTLYLKCYYPEEFYCSLLNNTKNGGSLEEKKEWMTKTIASAVAKGLKVLPPSRKSKWDCTITNEHEITLGFSLVKAFGEVAYEELMSLVENTGNTLETIKMSAFFSLPFSKFNKSAFGACLKAGVFDEWSSSREYLASLKAKKRKKTDPNQGMLFDINEIQSGLRSDSSVNPPTNEMEKITSFEEVCGFDLNFINRVARINKAILEKSEKEKTHIDPITAFNDSGDYFFFVHDIRYLMTQKNTEYLEIKVGDGVTTTKIRAFGDLAQKLKPELQKGAVYLSQFVENDKGFVNFKRNAKFKMIVEPAGDKLLTTV